MNKLNSSARENEDDMAYSLLQNSELILNNLQYIVTNSAVCLGSAKLFVTFYSAEE